jgi:N-acetylglucosaminyl-diphospho-decaprenol L-rhamnosyltransferase
MTQESVDVVVVNYESSSRLAACLDSVTEQVLVGSVVVIDNGSTDRSVDVVAARSNVRWVPTGVNLGFGAGANRGIAVTASAYVCVLNPDLVVRPHAIARLAEHLDANQRVAIAAPMVLNPDGTLYPSARSFPKVLDAIGHATVGLFKSDNPWTRRYKQVAESGSPDWVSGTAMLLRRSAVEAIGGFDERYFMYVEDVDLCWRLRQANWTISQVPSAEVIHEKGISSRRHPYRSLVDHHRSAWRFIQTTTKGPSRALLPVYAAGLATRLAIATVKLSRTSKQS